LRAPVNDAPRGPRDGSLRAAGFVSGLILVSRVLGLVREQVFATLLGAGAHADAFQIAFRIPNLLRDLFAEGALSAAFVPTYARVTLEGGRDAAHRLASRVFTLLAVVLGALVVLGTLFAGPLVELIAPGFSAIAGKGELTVFLTRVMLPFLPLVSFAAVAMGMLNAEERYGAPALAPAMFNVVAIVWGAVLWGMGLSPSRVVLGWSIGVLLGGVAQLATQWPALRAGGFRLRPEWAPSDPGIAQIARLMGPATAGLAAVQVNIFVNSVFASHEPGAVSWLTYAFRILYLPIGLFGVAAGTVATTGLAKKAASGDLDGLRETLRAALRALSFLTIPATAGLLLLGAPIVRLLYERGGAFKAEDTRQTAAALGFYGVGLVAYAAVKVLAPAFYALDRPNIPLLGSILSVATNLVLNLTLYQHLGFRSVALGTSLGAIVNALVLLVVFERGYGGLGAGGLVGALARMLMAAAAMGPVVYWSAAVLETALGRQGLAAHLAGAFGPIVAGLATYLVASRLLGVPELGRLAAAARRSR
jgi:putative peptidoglycan lipid II flippase